MLSYHSSAFWQLGQRDAGSTMDCLRGIRWMQTFRKLPSSRPNMTTATSANGGGNSIMTSSPRRLDLSRQRKQLRSRRHSDAARGGIQRERRARRIERHAWEQARGGDAVPRDGLAGMVLTKRLYARSKDIDGVHRVELRQPEPRRVAEPRLLRLHELLKQLAGRAAVPAFRQRDRGQRTQPRWSAGHLGGLLEARGRRLEVTHVPVIHKSEVLHVLPLAGLRRQSFPEQRGGEIGTARAVRILFAQKNRAEPVRNAEIRIERRRQIEERIEQRVGANVPGR